MKTIEELNALKNEIEALNRKLADLTEDELAQVTGGTEQGENELTRKLGRHNVREPLTEGD